MLTLIPAHSIINQSSHLPIYKFVLTDSKTTKIEISLINAEAPQMLMIANMIVSGTNAKTTMVIKTSHAQPKMHHIASNRTDNSIQDIAVHSKPIKSSVCHLLKKASKTEPIFLNALSLTMKTDVLIMKHANGKERRLCAMTPQDGKLRMALDALPLLRNSVLMETSQQDS